LEYYLFVCKIERWLAREVRFRTYTDRNPYTRYVKEFYLYFNIFYCRDNLVLTCF